MVEFLRQFKEWTGHLRSGVPVSEKQTQTQSHRPDRIDNEDDDHRHGAEGNVFHVNGEPEEDGGKDDDAR